MVKAKMGLKRVCGKCSTKYYDMKKNPPVCPNCGTEYSATARRQNVTASANKDFDDDIDAKDIESTDLIDDSMDDDFDLESDSNVLKEKEE